MDEKYDLYGSGALDREEFRIRLELSKKFREPVYYMEEIQMALFQFGLTENGLDERITEYASKNRLSGSALELGAKSQVHLTDDYMWIRRSNVQQLLTDLSLAVTLDDLENKIAEWP